MATVKRRGSSWQATIRIEGKERTRTFAKRVDAENWVKVTAADVLRGHWTDPRRGRTTFGEYAEQWRSAQLHFRPSTVATVERALRVHVLPVFGARSLGAIRRSDVQGWVTALSGTLAPTTVQQVYGYLATVLKAACNDGLIPLSPCTDVNLPRVETRQVDPLSPEAVERLVAAMPERYRAMVSFAADSGLRQGEVWAVTLDRVDWLRREVRVDRQIVLVSGKPTFGPPKTTASIRRVPLASSTLDALSAHVAAFPPIDGRLFNDDAGRMLRRDSFSRVWRPAILAAKLPAGTHFHELRHHYASRLIAAGCSVKAVQEALGHSSATETLNTYSHLWPTDSDRIRAAIEATRTPRGQGSAAGG